MNFPRSVPDESAIRTGDALTVARRFSHDLRSPLGAISTSVELLREILPADLNGKEALLAPIENSSVQMLGLIEKTALVLRATYGEAAIPEELDVGIVADAATGRLDSLRRKAGAEFSLPSKWPKLLLVQDWCYQIWRQLLSNALIHGGKRITLGWEKNGADYRFFVEDNGAGLPDGALEDPVPAFETLHAAHSGRGLGLTMVRRLAELMGGCAGYERRAGGLSRFWFELPAAMATQPPVPAEVPLKAVRIPDPKLETGPVVVELPAGGNATETRIEALRRTGLLDTPAEPEFDTITSLVRRTLRASSAFVTLIDEDRAFFKSVVTATGEYTGPREAPLSHTFCRHVVDRDAPLVVTDSSRDPLVCDNPSIKAFSLSAYMGVPIYSPSGLPLGSLCAITQEPREWTPEELEMLQDFATLVRNELILREERAALAESLVDLDEGRTLNRVVLENTGDCVKLLDGEGRLLEINQPGLALLEVEDFSGLAGTRWVDFWPAHYHPAIHEAVRRAKDGHPARFQGHCPTAKGSSKWWDVSLTAVKGPGGQVDRLLVVARDVSHEKETVLRIEESEIRLRKVLDALFAFVGLLDPHGILLEANATALQAAALKAGEVIGKPFGDTYWWSYSEESKARLAQAITTAASGTPVRYEAKVRLADAKFILIDFSLVPLMDDRGNVTHLVPSGVDLTARLTAERALSESELRFRTLANNMSQFAWMTDAEGWIFWYNQRWFDYTGTTLEEMQGWDWQKVHHPDHVDRVTEKFTAHLKSGEAWEDTFPLRGADGKFRWFLSRAIPVRNAAGSVVQWFGTNTDIDDHLKTQDALRRASQAKDDFIAVLSHELRTPLNPALLIASEAVSRADLSPEVREDFETIRRNIEMEARLIDDLLDLTRITRGKLPLVVSTVSMKTLMAEMLASLHSDAASKGVAVVEDLETRPTLLQGDDMRLRQVLWNVLRNAVKFTPAGGKVTLRTRTEADMCRITVEDSGIGMTDDELLRVFEPFTQGDHSGSEIGERFGGLGLGLAISKMLVELHGGRITAKSGGRGSGTTVRIELPISSAVPAAVLLSRDPEAGRPGPEGKELPMRILLVEDHDSTRVTLAMLLERRGHRVTQTATVAEAIRASEDQSFDLLMSDIGLPDGRGDDLMIRLRGVGHAFPGIALSGYGMESDIQRSRNAGFAQHLTKPVSLHELDRALRRVIRTSTASDGAQHGTGRA